MNESAGTNEENRGAVKFIRIKNDVTHGVYN